MTPSANAPSDSPWHAGELAIQQSIGVVQHMDRPGRLYVRNFLLDQHRSFYPLLHFVALGAVDAQGDAWATVRAGEPGFLHSPDAATLSVSALRDASDPAEAGMEDGDAIGLLGVDLMTRRRNRLNGHIRRTGSRAFDIDVTQSFGNCPRYIQNRSFSFARDPALPSALPVVRLGALDARARDMIARADTFYVASYIAREDGTRQVDVSHRGGKPGFVRVGDDGVLTIPDFSGNLFFMTLGNIHVNPKTGLLFIDSETGDMLQMTGDARVVLDSPEIAAFEGAERLWTFTARQVVHRPEGLPLRWRMEAGGWSPNLEMTGSWKDAAERLAAAALAQRWRPFRVARVVEESSTVRSLYLTPTDGVALIPPLAGQHLPVRMTLDDAQVLSRTYTLSMAPSDGQYRISVKKEGRASRHLHTLREGDLLEVRSPAGGFTVDAAERRPAVLLAAGIGITPLLAMLRHLVHEAKRTRTLRPAWLFQSARTREERPFDEEIAALVEAGKGGVRWVRTLSQPGAAVQGRDYEKEGRIDMALLKATLPFDDHDFYLCGPAAFMQATYDGLRALNVADARIHAETFGPSSLRRSSAGAEVAALPPVATESVRVVFTESGKESRWNPGDGSLLDVAEARGLSPAFGCRGGSCGTCKARVLEGEVTYAAQPSFPVQEGEALICCAVPSQASKQALHLAL
ncbi:pyridoxamine 5'-phosphate oxidase family protein [Variovorax sp. J22G73]|jgi:ferredoxin-NADP reductase/predicted pyridoxine 5'-phosphate oxidase superfamily flavin-nucleotide-binding protein|uniref:2Fe-2S iron-sulfur cluster-binding protein n=1 Tax=unclassified Variovorax TaxID=663243 RepID=UPI0025751D58|nr:MULTISPECIES: pyridoxamine 5'-phosphate oxidase family protein [unclassified Variovorax]MDM0005051.1 pyridoxamine 5'-phosphate oxidase family protein [Variovorax sp. J22R203]MDM0098467.1 pyridoxamine 5'-phosphate oxidase family protein [Variovorax sp. J22G73]